MDKYDDRCYVLLLERINILQTRIDELQKSVACLQDCYSESIELSEGCPDEIDGDRAAFKAVEEICLDSLLDIEPKGDA